MLTSRPIKGGVEYAKKHLEHSDYYDENRRIKGHWRGRGAELLGLSGEVTHEQFEAILRCEHPATGKFLRVRHSADRAAEDGSVQSNACNAHDCVLSAPKSVSIQAELEDSRLHAAHDTAVNEALVEVERLAAAEAQQGGKYQVHQTGNLVIATYRHHAARAADKKNEIHDPQLHTHCVLANMTYDAAEDRWKALCALTIYQQRAYLTEVYRNVLAREVLKLGYSIEAVYDDDGKYLGWELKNIALPLREKYSTRSVQKRELISQFRTEEGYKPNNDQIADLVRRSRAKKLMAISTAEVKALQLARLTPEEADLLRELRQDAERNGSLLEMVAAEPSMQHAIDHIFERVSVARDFEVLTEALRHRSGRVVLEEVKGALLAREATGGVLRRGSEVTTQEALARELEMLDIVNRGMGAHEALGGKDSHFEPSIECSPDQYHAVKFILASQDCCVGLRGPAGAGKTFALQQIRWGLHAAGKDVVAIAPSQTAVDELHKVGFHGAMTIAHLLVDQSAQQKLSGKVIFLDEASMVSARDMVEVLRLVEKKGCRLLFSGDTRQIRAVEAGDGLQTLERHSALQTTSLKTIRRQILAEYRHAMETLRVRPEKGLDELKEMGSVREVHIDDRAKALALAYRVALGQKNSKGREKSVLIVSATHADIEHITDAIRKDRQERGVLGRGTVVERFESLNWTRAHRADASKFRPGQVLVFHKATKLIDRYEALTVMRVQDEKVFVVNKHGREIALTRKQAKCFEVCKPRSIELAPGDKILLQQNRRNFKWLGFRATNGEIATVSAIDADGLIHLTDGRVLPADYRQFTYGYAVTAHRSQGKTVDQVLVSGDSMNRELFYVAATRAREAITVFTSHFDNLRDSIRISGARASAVDLAQDIGIVPRHKFRGRAVVSPRRGRIGRQIGVATRAFRTWREQAAEVKPMVSAKEAVKAFEDRGPYVYER